MKKNIGFITLDSSLVQWLRETLRTSAPRSLSAQELLEGRHDDVALGGCALSNL